jgi:hypothetical protein
MRLTLLFGLLFVIACSNAKHAKHNKANEWDELEGMLRKIDRIDKIKDIKLDLMGDEDEDDEDDDEPTEPPPTERPQKNPCEDHHCGWGKECMVQKNGKPKCMCNRECPMPKEIDAFDMVCSNQNETFNSICHLYQERCRCRRGMSACEEERHKHVHLEYLGKCKELSQCTNELLEQFSIRMADWLFQVMRDLEKRQELHGDDWIQMLEEAEQDDHLKHVYPVIWKFCDLDVKPHNKKVSMHELIPITAPVMPMESCIKPFLKKCDADGDEEVSLKEWGKCLGLKEEEIIERC